jgi:murein DD-endopeptidase MepM/ murein hydrolase activator NlpD
MPHDTSVSPFATRRERIDFERARPRRSRRPARQSLHLAIAAVSALGLLSVTALPMAAVAGTAADAPPARTAAAPAQRAVSDGDDAVPGPRDGYSASIPSPLLSSATTGDERVLDTGQLSDRPWALPVAGRITDGFGPRPDRPVAGVRAFHEGTDLATACGTPIHAALTGIVVQAGWDGTYGNWILLDHGDGIETGYAHIENGGLEVSAGESVGTGQEIARVGATGAATGCHLHFETRIDGKAVDAVPFMARRGVVLGAG